ncbi:hypothetical protein FRC06_004693 [Ceratobasidium sp. 370]|nr:hypothetical protein FRC06_004693 [Ceratobasidium sp. 370]
MAEHVMDYLCAYLVHSSSQVHSSRSESLCLVPSSLSGALLQIENVIQGVQAWKLATGPSAMVRLMEQRNMVWTRSEPPGSVIMPFINQLQVHCFLWFGSVMKQQGTGLYDLHLHLLDSLSQPTSQEVKSRLSTCTAIINFLLPQVNGKITGSYMGIPGYQQAPGSTDCGWFVCQAVSALSYGQKSMLHCLLPVKEVKVAAQQILEECQSGALEALVEGVVPASPIILHHDQCPRSAPWLSKALDATETPAPPRKQSPWVTPTIERSLSEPPGDTHRNFLGHGSWEDVFGQRASLAFEQVSVEAFSGYLEAINGGRYTAPPGLLAGVGAQLPESLMQALLLEGETSSLTWAPEAEPKDDSDEEGLIDAGGGAGLRQFLRGLATLAGGQERSKAILTGEHRNHPLHLNWAKETVDLDEEWLTAGLDIDSLSLTAKNPQFTSPAVFYAYPPRSSTLTTDNGLSVNLEGNAKKLSHSTYHLHVQNAVQFINTSTTLVPNFTFAHIGSSNQFRINIFFPHYEKGMNAGKRYITMLSDQDFTEWYEAVVWQAAWRLEILCPPKYQHAATSLRQILPKYYISAKSQKNLGGETFKGFKILPELFNLLLHYCRMIIEQSPQLQKFRGFFFHIYGVNLKTIGHEIRREDGNALLHVLKSYPIVDWSLQNPRDIAVDVGLEINLLQEMLPSDMDGLTLVWKLAALKQLARHGWRKAHINAYVHSHVVGGISANPRAFISPLFFFFHAYMKDKVLTYHHRDSSIGTGFSPEDGLSKSSRYVKDTSELRRVLQTSPGSFGVRMEWRCGVWAANQILALDPGLWVRRFLHSGAILAVRTSDVVKLKLSLLDAYDWFFSRLQVLRPLERKSERVLLMAAVLTYLMHGLVQRPDEMSSSRFMVKTLGIVTRARRFGIASVPIDQLSGDFLGMRGTLTFEDYKILTYTGRKNPAGARMKSSRLPPTEMQETEDHTLDTRSGASTFPSPAHMANRDELGWVIGLVNEALATWIWGRMNEGDKARNPNPAIFRGPLLLSRWQRCVDPGVQYQVRSSPTGFNKAKAYFYPPNWVLLEKGRVWQTLQDVFFDQIIQRLSTMDDKHQASYSRRVRSAIANVLTTWEFLPCVQKERIWSYTGSGRTKAYMLYRNPSFRSRT